MRRVFRSSRGPMAGAMALLILAGPGLSGAGAQPQQAKDATPKAAHCPTLQRASDWYGDNAVQIQQAIDERGRCSWRGTEPRFRPYAVFDWDNTVIKNDISDQTVFWMLRHNKILQPPNRDWKKTSRYMTTAGAKALKAACGSLAAPGKPLPTGRSVTCADEILSVRKTAETTSGKAVFTGFDHREMEASYAWVAQILQGYRPAQVRAIASQARAAALKAPVGATQKIGSSRETAWIRYYPQVKDLISTLKKAGIEPYVVSASPKEFADVWGGAVGIDRKHTLGISQLTKRGKLTGHLRGCGGKADGSDAIMTYVDGKRCFINQDILGIKGPRALKPAPRLMRPVVAGGDATTDVSMLSDATGARVVLNRNKDELMCRAYDNADGRWVINPMFIEPLPKRAEPYPCASTAYTDRAGRPGPVLRPNGTVTPDQTDTVHS
ncbi:haloacid dehalogenase-like hydrolase [Demetria terragena]|uniref:haloacid dehalogenase-like hydrolase n=1 Tax=Demetria terragena TaxID=63959 RepID=UPI0003A60034|nr:haloacid dehalogenase-like hydrolase [Demetria terragena]